MQKRDAIHALKKSRTKAWFLERYRNSFVRFEFQTELKSVGVRILSFIDWNGMSRSGLCCCGIFVFGILMHAYCLDDVDNNWTTILNFASGFILETENRSSHEMKKKLHEKCTRHESTRVQLPLAFSPLLQAKERISDETRELKRHQEKAFFAVEVLLI